MGDRYRQGRQYSCIAVSHNTAHSLFVFVFRFQHNNLIDRHSILPAVSRSFFVSILNTPKMFNVLTTRKKLLYTVSQNTAQSLFIFFLNISKHFIERRCPLRREDFSSQDWILLNVLTTRTKLLYTVSKNTAQSLFIFFLKISIHLIEKRSILPTMSIFFRHKTEYSYMSWRQEGSCSLRRCVKSLNHRRDRC